MLLVSAIYNASPEDKFEIIKEDNMNISNKIILITGASGGIGSSLVEQFVNKKAKKIYAADLRIENIVTLQEKYGDIIVPVKLDVTNADEIAACRTFCNDTEILINNAGVEFATAFLSEKALKASSIEMAVNYFGVHHLCFAFWKLLAEKKSAAIVNILSIASFSLILKLGTYCASKTAAHLLTQGLRHDAISTNIQIFGVYPGYVDTDMIKNLDVEKADPRDIAFNICNDIENNILDIFPDPMSKDLFERINYKNHIL